MITIDEILNKLEEHEKRINHLEDIVLEMRGELRINTALTLTILGALLGLIGIIVRGG